MDTMCNPTSGARADHLFARRPADLRANGPTALLRSVLATLMAWQERASQRHLLAQLGERELKDMGISRADAESEARKPFWRA